MDPNRYRVRIVVRSDHYGEANQVLAYTATRADAIRLHNVADRTLQAIVEEYPNVEAVAMLEDMQPV